MKKIPIKTKPPCFILHNAHPVGYSLPDFKSLNKEDF